MKSYGLTMEGPLTLQNRNALPAYSSEYSKVLVYLSTDGSLYFGDPLTSTWRKLDAFGDISGKADSGINDDITSMTGLGDDGIPAAKVTSCLMQSLTIDDLGDTATPSILTTTETINITLSTYQTSGADHVFTMPAALAAGNIIFVIGDEFQMDIEPDGSDLFYLNGTAMAVDEHIQNTADTLGETITGVCCNINGTLRWMIYSSFSNFVEETPA